MLKLGFPVNAEDPTATYEIQYGHIHRPTNGEEEPGLSWVDVSGNAHGLLLVNDSKYSYDVDGSTLSLTVLRSPVYAHHDPRKLDPNAPYEYIDQGRSRLRFRLVPHAGSWSDVRAHRLGMELNTPLITVVDSVHPGRSDRRGSYLTVSAANIAVSAVKRAEDSDAVVVRCFETDGISGSCEFRMGSASWTSGFGPCEIKTFLVDGSAVRETDILER
jgi:alpha-mannosidase